MPWKETCPMDQRWEFVVEHRSSALSIAALCRIYGISRPTGYKWLGRFRLGIGAAALAEPSRRPLHSPAATAPLLVRRILDRRRQYPTWGARKILWLLRRQWPKVEWPAASTVNDILKRHGLVRARKRDGVQTGDIVDRHEGGLPMESAVRRPGRLRRASQERARQRGALPHLRDWQTDRLQMVGPVSSALRAPGRPLRRDRAAGMGATALKDRSRQALHSPAATAPLLVRRILDRRALLQGGRSSALRRYGMIRADEGSQPPAAPLLVQRTRPHGRRHPVRQGAGSVPGSGQVDWPQRVAPGSPALDAGFQGAPPQRRWRAQMTADRKRPGPPLRRLVQSLDMAPCARALHSAWPA